MDGNGLFGSRAPWFAWRSNLALADEVRTLAIECGVCWGAASSAGRAITGAPVSVAAYYARNGTLDGLPMRRGGLRLRKVMYAVLEGREDALRREKWREWSAKAAFARAAADSDDLIDDDHDPGDDENAWDDIVRLIEG